MQAEPLTNNLLDLQRFGLALLSANAGSGAQHDNAKLISWTLR